MSQIIIEDEGWKAIMTDPKLEAVRRKLSFHEIRLIVNHARQPNNTVSPAGEVPLEAEKIGINKGREVVVTFADKKAAFTFFNELQRRFALKEQSTQSGEAG